MNKSNNKRSILLSVTALLIVFVLVVGLSFSWSEGGSRGYVVSPEITISSGSQLTILTDADSEGRINVPTDKLNLAEVSSADGRNFFFPTIDNISSKTTEMTFREGIPADENTKYLSYDFDIEGGDTNTKVYLGAGTVVQCNNKDVMSALRIALFANDGSTPYAIFRPNQMADVPDSYSPIATITALGEPTVLDGDNKVDTMPFGDYYYGNVKNQHLFTIDSGELKHLTVAMWLEGTEITGDYNTYKDVTVKLNLDFTTESDILTKYNFVDNCHNRDGYSSNGRYENHWVSNNITDGSAKYDTMMYVYDHKAGRYYAMTKQTGTSLPTWSIYLPESVKEFYFRRYSVDVDMYWNEWEPAMGNIPVLTVDNKKESTFIAIAGAEKESQEEIRGCYGYWKDQSDTIRIYFQMECKWPDLHCYAWTSDNQYPLGSWPGTGMSHIRNVDNDPNKPLYYIDIPNASKLAGIEFNSGIEDSRVYFEADYGYDNNRAYAWLTKNNSALLGAHPGINTSWDTNREQNYVVIPGQKYDKFKIQHYRVNDGAEVNSWNEGEIGKSYLFTESDGTGELKEFVYKIEDTQCFFNGSYFWYKDDSTKGFRVYHELDEYSLIRPTNY